MIQNVNQTLNQGIGRAEDIRQMQLRNQTALGTGGFASVLRDELNRKSPLQFSKHAAERVGERGISVTENFLGQLSKAVEKAGDKGAKDVVVISDRGAFIVNVPNRTVVTTMSTNEMKENIFTNIDSAVLL